jgi:hypothetical protein
VILLWGIPADEPLMAVRAALMRLGARTAFLDQRLVLDTEVDLSVGASVTGELRVDGEQLDLSEVTALYLRPYEWRRLPAIAVAGPESPEWWHALRVEDTLVSWAEITPAFVVNRPTPMAANTSKPYQSAQIRAYGFAIPATLITTDAQAVLEFRSEFGVVIYKSISGTRSIVARLTDQHRDRLADLAWCPTQFQEYIPGRDYRVHVVGTELFACEIISSGDDYRYVGDQGTKTTMLACDLPEDCAELCRNLAIGMQLSVAGIDLRRTPAGVWYCFEVNASPGFTYFEEVTGQPVAEAVARLLLAGSGGHHGQAAARMPSV